MKQRFKFDHHTVIYHGGGCYTLIADDGYLLQTVGGEPVKQTETNDYTQWRAIKIPAGTPRKKTRKQDVKLAAEMAEL